MSTSVEQLVTPAQAAALHQHRPQESGQPCRRIVIVGQERDTIACYERMRSWPVAADLEWAGDGFCGLLKIAASPPDLIIAEWEIPVFSGEKMIRIIKADPKFRHTAVITILQRDRAPPDDIPEGVTCIHAPCMNAC